MKITNVCLTPVVLVKDDPKWRNALVATPTLDGIVVRILTDKNIEGIGYASTNAPYKGVKLDVAQACLEKYTPYLVGENPFNIEKILTGLDEVSLDKLSLKEQYEPARAAAVAKSSLDLALHDILGKATGLPLYQLLGGLVREEVPVLRIMAIKGPEEMAENAMTLVKEGYQYLKIKMEGNPDRDLERIRAIRKRVGPKIHLTIDPNQSYSPDLAIKTIKAMEEYGIELVEQPVAADDFDGLAKVTHGVDCLVEAHESAASPEDVFKLVKDEAATCISLSVADFGLRGTRALVDICKAGKVKCAIACVGSRILSAASIHFAASNKYIDGACQVAEFVRFKNDPAVGLEVRNGMLRVPNLPGLGVEVHI